MLCGKGTNAKDREESWKLIRNRKIRMKNNVEALISQTYVLFLVFICSNEYY